MTALAHAALLIRRTTRASWPLIAVAGLALVTVMGGFRVPREALKLEHLLVGIGWAALLARQGTLRLRARGTEASRHPHDLELGILLLLGAHVVAQLTGGLESPLYPLVYVVVALVTSFTSNRVAAVFVLIAILYEAAMSFAGEGQRSLEPFMLHGLWIMAFGTLHAAFTQGEVARIRLACRSELEREKQRVERDARMFRLVTAPSDSSQADEARLRRSSVDEVHNHLYHILELLHRALDLHTCLLLFIDDDHEQLRVVERVTSSESVLDGPFPAGSGAVGAVVKRKLPMTLERLKPGYTGLCYYAPDRSEVRTFAGVPVVEDGVLRGILCGDRTVDRPFSQRDIEVLSAAAGHLLRALENERLFVQLERSKREQAVLYRASRALGSALSSEAVMETSLEAAKEIAEYDFAAIGLYDSATRKHSIVRAAGENAGAIEGLRFRDNNSLSTMVVKNRHYLPYRGDFDAKQQTIYTKRFEFKGMRSLLILPLLVRETATGTLTFAARRPGVFSESVRATLQVLANQLAVALANAAAVHRLEEMATTDGLTGCLNKRAFHEELERKIRAAERFDRKLSLIVTDIDHFKSVNDTYGHATGDVVIQGLGRILREAKRDTDVVARFGGEEFCMLCEETDSRGALLFAERVREELEKTTFETELGPLRVQCSVGVASFPENARDSKQLFEAADRALYEAKNRGRNQVCAA